MEQLRIIVVGKIGAGKSATANTILGCKRFEANPFTVSETKQCQRASEERFGKQIMVVDTPGLFDPNIEANVTANEVVRCLGIASPGPHVILLVVSIGRFTQEDRETVEKLADIFGEDLMYKHLIMVFTKKDQLQSHNITIQQYVSKNQPDLDEVLVKCNRRFVGFNNEGSRISKDQDVRALLKMIDTVVSENGCICNEIFCEIEEYSISTPESDLREIVIDEDDLHVEQPSAHVQTPPVDETSTVDEGDKRRQHTQQTVTKQNEKSENCKQGFKLLEKWQQIDKAAQEEPQLERRTPLNRVCGTWKVRDDFQDGELQKIHNTAVHQPNQQESGLTIQQLADIQMESNKFFRSLPPKERAEEVRRESIRQEFEAEGGAQKIWNIIRRVATRIWKKTTFDNIDGNM